VVHEVHEEHENHERWLVSYADMMTLLMVLFIVMFAISQVDTRKFAALKTGLTAGFGAPVAILSGGDQLLDPGGAVAPDSVNLSGAAQGTTPQAPIDPAQAVNPEAVAELAKATSQAKVAQEVQSLKQAQEALEAALRKAGLPNGATFRFDERGLVVTIATDEVLFPSANADLQPQGRKILDALGPSLARLPNRLSIDGHTNAIPIHTARFPSNWELSADRASGVLRYLQSVHHIPPTRMTATAFADTQPLVPNSDRRARVLNRRVEIVVIAQVDNSAGRAVAELGNGKAATHGTTTDSAKTAGTDHAAPSAATGATGHG
jgi:chemotaxis protein MotB